MGAEAGSQSTTTQAGAETSTQESQSAATGVTIESILAQQGLGAEISEADLTGISSDDGQGTAAPPESTATTEKPDDEKTKEGGTDDASKTGTEGADDDKSKQESADKTGEAEGKPKEGDKTPPDEGKPPKGFVPVEAVRELRREKTLLRSEVDQLREQINQLEEASRLERDNPYKDFQELSKDEFKALAEDDAAAALDYLEKLDGYKNYKLSLESDKQAQEQVSADLDRIYRDSADAMEKALPGIFDEDGTVMGEIRDFAESIGFDSNMFYLTNPATKIILPGETQPLVLGEQAADIISMLVNARKSITDSAAALEALKSKGTTDEAALREAIRKEVEAEVLSKLKTGGDAFRSTTQLPKDDAVPPDQSTRVYTEAEMMALPEAEQEKLLRGF